MRYIKLHIILVLVTLVISGCSDRSTNDITTIISEDAEEIILGESLLSDGEFILQEYPLQLDTEENINSISLLDDTIYLLTTKDIPMAQGTSSHSIKKYDVKSNKMEVLYEQNENVFNVLDLVSDGENLFYSVEHIDDNDEGVVFVKKMDLSSNEICDIAKYSYSHDSFEFLKPGDSSIKSYKMPLNSNERLPNNKIKDESILISNGYEIFNPFYPTDVNRDLVTFITEKGKEYFINIHNVKTDELIKFKYSQGDKINRLKSCSNYILWQFKDKYDILYVYDISENKLLVIDEKKNDFDLFSLTSIDNNLFVIGDGKVTYVDLVTKTKKTILSDSEESDYLVSKNRDRTLVLEKYKDKKISIVTIRYAE